MWPKAKRAVSDETARSIADISKAHGRKAVGVFVDEDAAVITERCVLGPGALLARHYWY